MRVGRYTDALQVLGAAVSLDPTAAWAHRLGADALLACGQPEALAAAREAVRLAPHNPDGYWCLTRVQLSFGHRKQARAAALEVARLAGPSSTLADRALGYAALLNISGNTAEHHYRRILAQQPLDLDALIRLSRILQPRQPGEALRLLMAGAAAHPTSSRLHAALRRCALASVRRQLTLVALLWGTLSAAACLGLRLPADHLGWALILPACITTAIVLVARRRLLAELPAGVARLIPVPTHLPMSLGWFAMLAFGLSCVSGIRGAAFGFLGCDFLLVFGTVETRGATARRLRVGAALLVLMVISECLPPWGDGSRLVAAALIAAIGGYALDASASGEGQGRSFLHGYGTGAAARILAYSPQLLCRAIALLVLLPILPGLRIVRRRRRTLPSDPSGPSTSADDH